MEQQADPQWLTWTKRLGASYDPAACYFAIASRFSLAQALSCGTAFRGGPPCVPQAHGPSVLASVMHEQDFVFRQAQT